MDIGRRFHLSKIDPKFEQMNYEVMKYVIRLSIFSPIPAERVFTTVDDRRATNFGIFVVNFPLGDIGRISLAHLTAPLCKSGYRKIIRADRVMFVSLLLRRFFSRALLMGWGKWILWVVCENTFSAKGGERVIRIDVCIRFRSSCVRYRFCSLGNFIFFFAVGIQIAWSWRLLT